MPTVIKKVRIGTLQHILQLVDFIFQPVAIHHGKILMMIVLVMCFIGMIMNQPVGMYVVLMVDSRMQQDAESPPLQRGNGNDWHAQHLRQTVQVNFHTTFFDNIHHVERYYDRPPQFEQLQSQIEISFQRRCIDDIDDDIDVIT